MVLDENPLSTLDLVICGDLRIHLSTHDVETCHECRHVWSTENVVTAPAHKHVKIFLHQGSLRQLWDPELQQQSRADASMNQRTHTATCRFSHLAAASNLVLTNPEEYGCQGNGQSPAGGLFSQGSHDIVVRWPITASDNLPFNFPRYLARHTMHGQCP